MQFSTFFTAAALSGLAAAVQLSNTVYNDITAGSSYSIGWINATGPVTLLLKNGGANNLQTVSTITSGATTSPFSWSVPSNLPADTYAIEISDSTSTLNYSPQFQLLGATASASATASSTATVSSSGSSTASSVVYTSTSSIATLTTTANSTSSTATSGSNSTASATGSSSGTSAGSSKTTTAAGGSKTSAAASSSSSVPATNSATEFASPLALVFLTFAAIFTLN